MVLLKNRLPGHPGSRLVLIFLYALAFTPLVLCPVFFFPYNSPKILFFRLLVSAAAVAAVWSWAKQGAGATAGAEASSPGGRRKRGREGLTIALAAFVVAQALAGVEGCDPAYSFWSNLERGDGVLQLILLLLCFLLLVSYFSDRSYWHRFFRWSVIAAALTAISGLAEVHAPGESGPGRFTGTLGNAAFAGAYFLFAAYYALVLACINRPGKIRSTWIGAAGIFALCVFWTQTRGAVLGLGAGSLAGLLLVAFDKRPRRRWVAGIAIAIAIIGIGAIAGRGSICSLGTKIRPLRFSFSSRTMQTRLALWETSWRGFQDRPLLGWGPENARVAIERHLAPELASSSYDRAHNIVFDQLLAAGAVGLAAYLGIFVVFVRGLVSHRKRRRDGGQAPETAQDALALGIIVAYVVQGMAHFDTLIQYLNLLVVFGYSLLRFRESRNKDDGDSGQRTMIGGGKLPSRRGRYCAAIAITAALAAAVDLGVYRPAAKAFLTMAADSCDRNAEAAQILQTARKAVSYRSPIGQNESAGAALAALNPALQRENDPAIIRAIIAFAESSSQAAQQTGRGGNAVNLLFQAAGIEALGAIRLGEPVHVHRGRTLIERALGLSPHRLQLWMGLYDLRRREGENAELKAIAATIDALQSAARRSHTAQE